MLHLLGDGAARAAGRASPTPTTASSPTARRSPCSTTSGSCAAPTSRRSSRSSTCEEPTHAFYLGKELARASLAITLGKTYRQEGALSWGYLTPPDDAQPEHVRLTQRAARRAAPRARERLTRWRPSSKSSCPRPIRCACCRAARRAAVPAVPRQRRGRRAARALFVRRWPIRWPSSQHGADARGSRARRAVRERADDALRPSRMLAPHASAGARAAAVSGRRGRLSRATTGACTLERLPAPRFDDLALDDVGARPLRLGAGLGPR